MTKQELDKIRKDIPKIVQHKSLAIATLVDVCFELDNAWMKIEVLEDAIKRYERIASSL